MAPAKLAIISSRGGHLFEILQLRPWWKSHPRFWITFPGKDTQSLLEEETVYFAHYPESRHFVNALKNFLLAWKILLAEKPDILVSCGAGIAPPFFIVGKILGIKLIFIELYEFVSYPTLSAKIISHLTPHLLVQHPQQLKFFNHAIYKGSLL